jgi:DNA-binding response OmpR family regulator
MKKIMVVDDDKDLLVSMKSIFMRQGYTVAVTTSCNEGLQILHSFQPDLIFLDINVGDEDGRVMCRAIRSRAEYQHIPIVLISANHDELKLFRDAGANAFMKKPFALSGLINALDDYL